MYLKIPFVREVANTKVDLQCLVFFMFDYMTSPFPFKFSGSRYYILDPHPYPLIPSLGFLSVVSKVFFFIARKFQEVFC